MVTVTGDAPTIDDARRIPVPASPCISIVDGLGWQDPIAVRVGAYDLGVRGNTEEAQALVRTIAGDRVVDDGGVPMPRNLSVHLATQRADATDNQQLHRLYHGHHMAIRSRSAARVLAGLDAYLDAHALVHDPERMQLWATALVDDGVAHLLPGGLRDTAVKRLRSLGEAGLSLVDRPWVEVDLATGELVVPPPSVEPATLDLPDDLAVDDDPTSAAPPGRYSVVSILRGRDETMGAVVLRTARAVANLARLDETPVLEGVATLVASTWPGSPPDAVGIVAR